MVKSVSFLGHDLKRTAVFNGAEILV